MHQVGRNQWPSELTLWLTDSGQEPALSQGVTLQGSEVANMVVQTIGTAFLKFYERNAPGIRSKYPGHPKTWPPVLLFAWYIRNAIAHGDRFSINDKTLPAVTWREIQISPHQNELPWFDPKSSIGGGDVVALMQDMLAVL